MKKPEEIKQDIIDCTDEAIAVSETGDAHDLLDFADKAHVRMATALMYIQRLELRYSQVSKALCNKENAPLDEVLQAVSQVKAELEAVKRERDAAAKDNWFAGECFSCKYGNAHALCDKMGCYGCESDCPCAKYPCGYEWRGVCPENTEVQDDGH